ncbi:MAG: UDP-N-acetylmuramate dehydrogenase [Lachnospiraceae bacterium]|nr:UDP-N-acetylmuramate dehydrogenase [Lachnospiraceae bacterium]
MGSDASISALKNIVSAEQIHLAEPMSAHTTFRVGGPVDCLVEIRDKEELRKIRAVLQTAEIPFFVMGNGSNLLVSDEGYRGVILKVQSSMNQIRVDGNAIIAQAGATMAAVARAALEHGLTGLEFASGIPGTIGGGISMNAGAYGGEMSQVVRSVEVIDSDGNLRILSNADMQFDYRTSAIKDKPITVTEVTLDLTPGDPVQIKALMDDLAARRRDKQPLEYPSAGSTFKRPTGNFAGKLIQDAGLRGYAVNGAMVSEKHCGFVVNTTPGVTTAADIMQLIRHIQKTVNDQFNIKLEPEVIFLGEF